MTPFCVQVNPEAPSGSFRRKDLERQAGNAGKKSNVGLDGKVYAFIDAPSDESSNGEVQKGAFFCMEAAAVHLFNV